MQGPKPKPAEPAKAPKPDKAPGKDTTAEPRAKKAPAKKAAAEKEETTDAASSTTEPAPVTSETAPVETPTTEPSAAPSAPTPADCPPHRPNRMPNIAAILTIGRPDARKGFRPSHWAYLLEGKHPMWFVTTTPAFPGELGFKRVWVTRRDTVVDGAMAMVAVVVEGIPTIVQRIDPATDEQVDWWIAKSWTSPSFPARTKATSTASTSQSGTASTSWPPCCLVRYFWGKSRT